MASGAELPVKLFYRIGEVAEIVGVETHVLRYWEGEFKAIRPQKSAKGQRVYSRKDLEKLLRVKELLYTEGYTIAGAKKQLKQPEPSARGAPVADAELAGAGLTESERASPEQTSRAAAAAVPPAIAAPPLGADSSALRDLKAQHQKEAESLRNAQRAQEEAHLQAQAQARSLAAARQKEMEVLREGLSRLRSKIEAELQELDKSGV